MEQLLEGLKDIGASKSIQKKISKIPTQQLENMLNKYGGGSTVNSNINNSNLTARDKLRAKLKASRESRMSQYEKNLIQKRQNEKTTSNVNEQPVLSEQEQLQKFKNKMKRLQQKYHQIDESSYFESLNQLNQIKNITNRSKQTESDMQRHQNIIDLYHYQHRNDNNMVEKELELSDDE